MMNGTAHSGRRARANRFASIAASCFAPFAILVILLSGCASVQTRGAAELLPLLGTGASVYAVIPVKANRQLAETVLTSAVGQGASPASLDRVETLCAGIFSGVATRAAISGNIPKSASSLAFSKSGGWTAHSDAARGSWYTRENRAVSIPRSGVLLYAEGEGSIKSMLDSFASPAPVATSPAFDAWLSSPDAASSVGIYVSDFASVSGGFLGPELELPVDHAEVFLKSVVSQSDESDVPPAYSVTVHIAMKDSRATRAMVAMLRLAALASGSVPDIRGEGSDIYVSDFSMSGESLAGMASFLYLDNNVSQ
jgi:hypothetical protein